LIIHTDCNPLKTEQETSSSLQQSSSANGESSHALPEASTGLPEGELRSSMAFFHKKLVFVGLHVAKFELFL